MASNPVTVSLGDMAEPARRLLESGRFESMSEVIQAGLEALDREEAAFNEYLRVKVAEALADPRSPIPLKEAMAQIRAAPFKTLT